MSSPELELTAVHDQCLAAWEEAFRTGEADAAAEFTAPSYQGFFGYPEMDALEAVDQQGATVGLHQFAAALRGCTHRAFNRSIHIRTPEEAVIQYERTLQRDSTVVITFLVMQTWRRTAAGWRVLREMAERL